VPFEVFLLVIAAAIVHALWNTLVKTDGDRLSLIKIMSATQIVVSIALIPLVDIPPAASWLYIAASAALNTGYMLLLRKAYAVGDLSLIYPLARGVAPLLVALTSIALLGESLTLTNKVAVLLIALGIISLTLTRSSSGMADTRAIMLALATGTCTAAYTVVDGLGARTAGSAHGYMVWLSLVTSVLIVGIVHAQQRGQRPAISPRTSRAGIAAGIMSYGGSWIVIWAMTKAPLALVSALRETGVVFAVMIGALVLKEAVNLRRLASIATTLTGTTMLKLGR
jgi:drug/metabolite transporter (DMT)-like permease